MTERRCASAGEFAQESLRLLPGGSEASARQAEKDDPSHG